MSMPIVNSPITSQFSSRLSVAIEVPAVNEGIGAVLARRPVWRRRADSDRDRLVLRGRRGVRGRSRA
ncbi:Uncharacterised protein [Mycobacteroides abscessus subsp. abscessus]|nr:Uncharacterised protein [Mycobacteroides abscessus subsp. abscessus]